MAVDSVTPTLFVISEGGDLLRWLVLNLDFVSQASDIFQFFLILCMQVWLCWLHEGAKRHSGGGKGVLCLWFQGYFPSMYMAVASEKLPKYPTKDKIVPPGPQCGSIHRGRGLREADRVSGEGGVWTPWMYESHTNCWGEGNYAFLHNELSGARASPISPMGSTSLMLATFSLVTHMETGVCWDITFFFGPYCWAWPYDGLIFAPYNGIHVHF